MIHTVSSIKCNYCDLITIPLRNSDRQQQKHVWSTVTSPCSPFQFLTVLSGCSLWNKYQRWISLLSRGECAGSSARAADTSQNQHTNYPQVFHNNEHSNHGRRRPGSKNLSLLHLKQAATRWQSCSTTGNNEASAYISMASTLRGQEGHVNCAKCHPVGIFFCF